MKKRLRLWVAIMWQPTILGLAALGAAGFAYWFKLTTLVAGLSYREHLIEQQVVNHQLKLSDILFFNPVHLPHKLVLYVLQFFHGSSVLAIRSVNAVLALLIVIAFFSVVDHWYTRRMAILTTTLFALSSWVLHLARLATPDIWYLAWIVLVALCIKTLSPKSSRLALVLLVLLTGLSLYIPGYVWLIIPIVIWQRSRLLNLLQNETITLRIILSLTASLAILPLLVSIVQHPQPILSSLLGFPEHWPGALGIIKNILAVPVHLFWRAPLPPDLWLGKLPLIDGLGTLAILMGIYWYWFKRKLDRTKLIFGILAIGSIIVSFEGSVSIAILLPGLYLLIGAGLTLLLQQWYTVFPRNPIARSVGAGLLTITLLVSVYYNVQQYYVAWPHAPATRHSFPYSQSKV